LENLFYFSIFIFIGAVIGSFVTAMLFRMLNGESWIVNRGGGAARSECPKCHHVLGIKDLVPVFSWILQRGRCRYCHEKIPIKYLLIEALFIFLACGVYSVFGFSILSFFLLAVFPFIFVQGVLLFRTNIISEQLCGIIIGLILFYLLLILII